MGAGCASEAYRMGSHWCPEGVPIDPTLSSLLMIWDRPRTRWSSEDDYIVRSHLKVSFSFFVQPRGICNEDAVRNRAHLGSVKLPSSKYISYQGQIASSPSEKFIQSDAFFNDHFCIFGEAMIFFISPSNSLASRFVRNVVWNVQLSGVHLPKCEFLVPKKL